MKLLNEKASTGGSFFGFLLLLSESDERHCHGRGKANLEDLPPPPLLLVFICSGMLIIPLAVRPLLPALLLLLLPWSVLLLLLLPRAADFLLL